MHNRLIPPPRRHQLVVSLSPGCLHVLHFRRGWLGWKQTHTHQTPLPEGDDYLQKVQSALKECSQQWQIPASSDVHWVLAGDIMGVLAPTPATASAEVGSLLPFAPSNVLTQTTHFGQGTEKSLLWIHKDWVAEIERITAACGLQAVELFSRAQLFQPLSSQAKGQICMVLEGDKGQPHSLHIFAPDGAILRSRIVEPAALAEGLGGLLKIELASLPEGTVGHKEGAVGLWASTDCLPVGNDWHHPTQPLPAQSEATLLEQLWRSPYGGIVLQATHQYLVQKINFWSMVWGVVGLVGLAGMLWHDGKLERQIEQAHESLRKEAPKVEAAKLLKAKTLWMADVVQAVQAQEKESLTLPPLPQVLAVFPPAPAALLYLRLDAHKVLMAGTGDEAAVQWLHEHPLPEYQPFTEMPVPDFLASQQDITIHLQTEKQATPAQVPAEATPATAPAKAAQP
ncbi:MULTISPECIES: hypothetical protein [Giesbergeria]|uniref:Uncharacterized protein n=1 Tax=Giesbergeria sinuosa TaxID=80883 RepID=A0ABV9Q9J8_9BURK